MTVRRIGAVVLALAVLSAGCRRLDRTGAPVDVVYAASLTAVMRDGLAPAYQRAHGREVRGVARGSSAGALQVRDGLLRAGAYVTADPATLGMLGDRDPGWAVVFSRGELVVGYAEESRFGPALDSAARGLVPWHRPVLRAGFRLGRTDPELDPKGYRALWLFRLAETHHGVAGLADGLKGISGVYPEEHLAARVETGQLDAGIFYRSEARAHGLRAVPLPPEVNLGDPDRADRYRELTYRTADGEVLHGAPVAFAATVPRNAPDPTGGADFVAFLLSPAGREALRERGYRPASAVLGDRASLPAAVRGALEGDGPDTAPAPPPGRDPGAPVGGLAGTSGDSDGRKAPTSPTQPLKPR